MAFKAAMIAINNNVVVNTIGEVSRWCLVTAIAALGMKTSLKMLFEVGWRPVSIIVIQTLFIAGLVLAGVLLMRPAA